MMETFCGSKYWDPQLSWNTTNPDLTYCFQETALAWTPCVFLWLLSPYSIYTIIHSSKPSVPWNALNTTKLVLSLTLIVISTVELIDAILRLSYNGAFPVTYYTPFIKLLSFILSFALIYFDRRKGIHTSEILGVFWFLLTLTSIVNYRSIFLMVFFDGEYNDAINGVIYVCKMAFSPIIFTQFILSCFSDSLPGYFRPDDDEKECPKNSASFLSILTFWWVNPLIKLGYRKPLTMNDMWKPNAEITTDENIRSFTKHYDTEKSEKLQYENIKSKGSNVTIVKSENNKNISKPKPKGIMTPLLRTYWLYITLLFVLKLISSLIMFVNPTILDWLIQFVADANEPLWKGLIYAVLMFFTSMVESLVNSQYSYYSQKNALRMRSCVTNTIYKKSLKLSPLGRKNFTIGEIVNLMSIDTHRIVDFIGTANNMWSAPLQIGVAIYLLWAQIGYATLAGIAVMILLIPFNGFISARMRLIHIALMKMKDKRIKLMNEILSGIRVIKMYAWESSFNDNVTDYRAKEINKLNTRAYLQGFMMFSFQAAQFLVAVVSFALFVLIDSANILTANIAFVSLTLFGLLSTPLTQLPQLITGFIMFLVSLRRVNKYLNADELDDSSIEHDPNVNPIVVKNTTFTWSKDDENPTLRDISMTIKKNKLVAIVGSVGSGKSSMLSALLGDMVKLEGKVNLSGSVAFVPQQAWIQNSTLRNNVLFTLPMNRQKFDNILEACALLPDLEILPGGEMTEIGEKGINLSGGQKQRVSMARACYADADIYFLDDPISALDANVSKQVFDNVIGPNGILKNKTRILVTHRISVLPKVDEIIVMKDGTISEYGTYKELIERKGNFAEFLVQYLAQQTENLSENEDLEVIEEMITAIQPQLKSQLSLSNSVNYDDDDGLRKRAISVLTNSIESIKSQKERRDGQKKDKRKERQSRGQKKRGKLTEDEHSETGSVKWQVYIDYLRKVGWISLITVLMSEVILSALSFASSLWLSAWSDDSLDPIKIADESLRNLRIGVYGGLGFGQTAFTFVSSLCITLACLKGAKILHDEMLIHMMHAPMFHFDITPMGRILNRFSKDIDTADTLLGMNIRGVMMVFFRTIVSFSIIGWETPYVLLAIIPLGVIYYFIQRVYIATSRQLRRIQSNARSPVLSHFSETLSGSSTIRAYGLEKEFILESDNRVDTHHITVYESLVAGRWLSTRLEFLGYSIILIDALFIVLWSDTISPGVAGLTLTYAMRITSQLNQLVNSTTSLETNIVSVERCLEYTQTPTEKEWFIEETKPPQNWPSHGAIHFSNYSTRYREGLELVLKQITFEVIPGERIGVIGRTGAGKSSLTLALFRLLEPVDGTIYIDSVDIKQLGLYELRSRLTIIPQDPILFTGNLRQNLDPFDRHSDAELWSSLELAHLKQFVSSLSAGLEHTITEGGGNLSVGQKQLVCLARALLRQSRILILDEATAAVDVETDDLIQNTIRKEFKNSTIVTIAHRLNTILDYDRILVMDNGQIAEFDSPQMLLNNSNSLFYKMAKDAGLI